MGESIIGGLTEMVTGSASAIADGVQNLMYTTGADGTTEVSVAGKTIFTVIGIGFGVGLMSVIFGLLRMR